MSQNYIKLEYYYDCRTNKGDYLEILSFLASQNIRFDLCASKTPKKTRLIIGDKSISYEEFREQKTQIEKLVEIERKSRLERVNDWT